MPRVSRVVLLLTLGLATGACGNGTVSKKGGTSGSSGSGGTGACVETGSCYGGVACPVGSSCNPTTFDCCAVQGSGSSSSSGGTSGGSSGGSIPPAGDAGVCNFACPAGQFCASTGDCVQCLSDADCSASPLGPYCDTRSGSLQSFGSCVQCVASSQCGAGMSCDPAKDLCGSTCSAADCAMNMQICDAASGACVDCLSNSDCPLQEFCDPVTLSCVACLQPTDCPAGIGCYQGACGHCNVSSDCPGSQSCIGGACVCASNPTCPASAPICFLDAGPGVCGCASNASCTGASQVCDATQGYAGACVTSCNVTGACLATTDTGQALCDTSIGLCVQCLSNAQCTNPQAPFCLLGVCATCASDSDCDADAGTPYCYQGLCSQCYEPSQCPASAPGCNSVSSVCGSCSVNSDCPSPQGCGVNTALCAPFCGTAQAIDAPDCAACATSTDCGGTNCNADAGLCG